ncbi:3-hydroxybutyryl-CoA dehydrogenase [Reticulomyxa filosa]|uniref:3-hydroxybutyryl-CoA dehydrogenase n=1 Tax=Reticulomyxa filosa TaxID=46433 RepID=X6NYK5_RETFI|nr:3-hydroxybutyryl-CoA dehydrogenase [Reticulomyxa filosa]|eukprot:ETO30968.1 3-hydroxybutyryl-CoA dehydrogenase [Reticulomyxa filosa]
MCYFIKIGRINVEMYYCLFARYFKWIVFRRSVAEAAMSTSARSTVNTLGVVGGGQMGMGITVTAATQGKKKVICVDSNAAALQKSLENSKRILASQVTKGKITAQEKEEAIARIVTTQDLNSLKDVDFVIEAVPEDPFFFICLNIHLFYGWIKMTINNKIQKNEKVKKSIFEQVSKITQNDVILASNTSSIPITRIASWVSEDRRDKVCGMHFMNPVPVMQLVEIIPGLQTSNDTKAKVIALAEQMGKTTSVSRDDAGFIANRILMPYINEAVFVLQEGIATKEDIDKTMKLGTNVPMGPLTLADFIGLDTCLFIQQTLYESTKDSKYKPAPLLQRYVEAGWLGRKTGRGFYNYEIKKDK